jgi:hypothetical protein
MPEYKGKWTATISGSFDYLDAVDEDDAREYVESEVENLKGTGDIEEVDDVEVTDIEEAKPLIWQKKPAE